MDLIASREKIAAVVDIGSASAGIALLSVAKGKPARVIAAARSSLPIEERARDAAAVQIGERLRDAMQKTLSAYATLHKKAAPVTSLYCVIHAPWTRSAPARTSKVFDSPIAMTEALISEAAKSAFAANTDIDRSRLLEASVVRVELNGYPTAAPVGKTAQSLDVSVLLSECDAKLKETVQQVLAQLFPALTPVYRSSVRALLAAVQDAPYHDADRFVVDMTGEGTTLVVVRDGTAEKLQLVPEGARATLRRLSPQGMQEEIYTMLRMIARDQCATPACDAIQSAMARAEPELVRIFGEAMGACTVPRRLPNSLLLLVHPDLQPWLSKFFGRIDFAQFTQTLQPFDVKAITTKDLSRALVPERHVVLDPSLALSAALVNTEAA